MRTVFKILNLLFSASIFMFSTNSINAENSKKSLYDYNVKDITGKEISLKKYKGKVILIVNVASKCGYTYQYEGLEKIYKKFKNKNFIILGFPANNFLNQEPGTNEEIKQFCALNYGVTFPVFSKISVKGKDIHPLYSFLTSKETNPEFGGRITWNFNKFLIDKNGKIAGRFTTKEEPESEIVINTIERLLN